MTITSAIALVAAVGLLAAIPGPGVVAVVAQSLTGGLRRGLAVTVGIVVGDLVFLLLAVYGLAWLAASLGTLFETIRIAGGLYLMWLGVSLLRTRSHLLVSSELQHGDTMSRGILSGLAITLGNPKVIVFYLSLLPTLLDLNALSPLDIPLVAALVVLPLGSVLGTYAVVAARTQHLFRNEKAGKWIRQTAGCMMLASGVAILSRSD